LKPGASTTGGFATNVLEPEHEMSGSLVVIPRFNFKLNVVDMFHTKRKQAGEGWTSIGLEDVETKKMFDQRF